MSARRAHVFVAGRVQGVFFRDSTRRQAIALGLRGFARNLPDGRVEIVLEGEEGPLQKALEFVQKGPPGAEVRRVDLSYEPPTGEPEGFEIVR
ncbi:MAG: acylphosphatase [Myxococcota bacterium]